MSDISRKLEKLIKSSQEILPVKTEEGILVGDVLIVSKNNVKDLYQRGALIYKDLFLNVTTIRLANLLAKKENSDLRKAIYKQDHEYSKWYTDSQILKTRHQQALNRADYERADIYWARYCVSKNRAILAKEKAESLCKL